MEGLPNRKQRRAWAKQTGLLKKKQNANFKDKVEMMERSAEVGRQIHFSNTEKNMQAEEKRINDVRASKIAELMESKNVSLEEATKIVDAENGNLDSNWV